jgi:hypothetical protein
MFRLAGMPLKIRRWVPKAKKELGVDYFQGVVTDYALIAPCS